MNRKDKYTIYSITYNDEVIYVGFTHHGKHRWTCHKTKARNPNQHSRPIHDFMRSNTTDLKTFPEFQWNVLCECEDSDIATDLERYFQQRYDVFARAHKIIRPVNQEYVTR
jgi:hypothetical protein